MAQANRSTGKRDERLARRDCSSKPRSRANSSTPRLLSTRSLTTAPLKFARSSANPSNRSAYRTPSEIGLLRRTKTSSTPTTVSSLFAKRSTARKTATRSYSTIASPERRSRSTGRTLTLRNRSQSTPRIYGIKRTTPRGLRSTAAERLAFSEAISQAPTRSSSLKVWNSKTDATELAAAPL